VKFSPGNPFTLSAPAKINWFLQVKGRRADGFHEISSLMQSIDLYDYLTFENADNIEIISELNIPERENIVYKAANEIKANLRYQGGARIHLKKNIPVAAGLGGGSSDAACVLLGLIRLWGISVGEKRLYATAAKLGSDVPFFLGAPAAIAAGRGEQLRRARIKSSYTLLLVKPPIEISTAWAYSRLDNRTDMKLTKETVDIKLFCRALNNRDFESLRRLMRNDFEEVIMREYPVVRETKERLLMMGAAVAAMSGSGPSVFGVFVDTKAAEEALGHMKPNFCRLAQTIIEKFEG
jgi:4-diphosphocytidyl-2-C-methyl-D-erythritol kinase